MFRLAVFQINNLLVYASSCCVRNRFTTTLSENARSDFNARRCLCFSQCFKTFVAGNMRRGGPFEPERHLAFIIGIPIRVAYLSLNFKCFPLSFKVFNESSCYLTVTLHIIEIISFSPFCHKNYNKRWNSGQHQGHPLRFGFQNPSE